MSAAVYAVLVELAGAREDDLEQFLFHWPDCNEYRFQGYLGFGGKVWAGRFRRMHPYVTCYQEDETPERLAIIERTNTRLAELRL